jgi:hypothetical protein
MKLLYLCLVIFLTGTSLVALFVVYVNAAFALHARLRPRKQRLVDAVGLERRPPKPGHSRLLTRSQASEVTLALLATSLALHVLGQNADPVKVKGQTVLERGPHHRVVQTVTPQAQADGTASYTTNSYHELATGMHFIDQNGNWAETQELIEVAADGSEAFAKQGPSKAIFAANVNSIPCVDMLTSDSKRLQSHVLGLAYYDAATGKSVMIAETKDAIGEVVPPNQILYQDAMTDFACDIRYSYKKCGLEQDIILRQQPPPPQTYGLNPASTKLQVWTEFFDPPAPQIQRRMIYQESDPLVRQAMVEPDWMDDYIDFEAMHIGLGHAFSLDGSESLFVFKEWVTISARNFLVESLSYSQVKPLLDVLPVVAAVVPNNPASIQMALQARPVLSRMQFVAQLPKATLGRGRTAERMQTAMINRARPRGVTLDYSVLASATNFTFKGDTTYYVNGPVSLSATTTFEGGSVIKFTNSTSATINLPSGSAGSIKWLATSYRPVIFTSMSDDTVGEIIANSTGNPAGNYYGNPCLNIDGSTTNYPNPFLIQNVRFAYAKLAISAVSGSSHVVTHAQVVNCQNGFQAWYGTDVSVRNALFFNVLTNFSGDSSTFTCQNVTSDTANYLRVTSTLNLYNCLLTSVTNASYNSASYTSNLTSSAGVYQTVGAGAHYLAANSPYRNVGNTSIDPTLLADLRKKTTYPPTVLTSDFTVNTTLPPLAARDTDVLDLGYHYDPLDYAWTQLNLTNATLTLTNGVAIGIYGTNGTRLLYGAQFVSQGTANTLNRLVRYPAVQEQSIAWGPTGSIKSLLDITNSPSVLPTVNLRFTDVSMLAGDATVSFLDYRQFYFIGSFILRDSQVRGGNLSVSTFYMTTDLRQSSYGLTNNLMQRASLGLSHDSGGGATTKLAAYVHDNLFQYGSVTFKSPTNDVPYEVKDNLFDTVALAGSGGYLTNSNNGYYSTTALSGGSNNKTLTVVDYLTGPLGAYYYPTTGANGGLTNLINAGSTTADLVGLYHFTTSIGRAKETNSIVDIGYHYIATDANGNPLDYDGDGIFDYIEDYNGNGVFDSGETDWKTYNSLNGLPSGPGLQVFTPLKP